MEDQLIGAFSVSIKFRNVLDDFSCIFTSVYGASYYGDHRQYWQELRGIRLVFDDPWLTRGDFNAILSPDERNIPGGGVENRNSFKAFVHKSSLIDIPMAGGRFIWTNSQQPPLLSRLDTFLLCPDFMNHCLSPMQVRLRRPISDHARIMLHCNFEDSRKSPFRLDNFILHHPDFINNLRLWWDNLSFSGSPSFIFAKKLQDLKFFIKIWQKQTFGNLQAQIDNLELKIDVLDNLEEIADETKSFYSSLFTENHKIRPGFDNLVVPQLSVTDNIHLETPFSEEEVKKVVKEFESTCKLDWRINSTNITLIPKCNGAVSLPNFRPISLIGSVYKIISKLLAERMKMVFLSIISEYQGAFVHGRQIQDGILIASELIDTKLRSQETGLICKVDFEKAFDNLNWNCIDITLARFGFGMNWRSWIRWCISTPRFAVLLKGEATDLFKSQKGIRQGDPISPFIFILVAEVLSLMFKKAANDNLITGFKVSQNGTIISHLQFADDLIVFLKDDEEQIQNLKHILTAFELISGLKVNYRKSTIVGLGQLHNGGICAETFGFSSSNLPMNYLGIPIGSKSKSKMVWGGVGIKKLQLVNKALHVRWIWRYRSEKQALWRRIINEKFGGGVAVLFPNHINMEVCNSLWLGILKTRDFFEDNTILTVRSGNSILFWEDVWVHTSNLKSLFPNLYKICRTKHKLISDLISVNGVWDFQFSRNLKDEEILEVANILQVIGEPPLNAVDDERQWRYGDSFAVSNAYSTLEDGGFLRFPDKQLWNSKVPLKVSFMSPKSGHTLLAVLVFYGVFLVM
ncbi:uncharacterized protein LOC113296156 [Papaver somniferum]|uniref:uncharacterized protein LOC113296156 n=1 Tax=Papaver somniferum TaxID=3469 RepID=UPI000E6F96EA|nr:uncharacterized protein LOC113296156 [Papaver somniferum]